MTRLNYCAIPVHCRTGQRGRDREVAGPVRGISELRELPIADRPVRVIDASCKRTIFVERRAQGPGKDLPEGVGPCLTRTCAGH